MSDVFDEVYGKKLSKDQRDRGKAERKLALLKSWLEKDFWSLNEACHILCGIDPSTQISEAVFLHGEVLLGLLPGIRVPKAPYEWHDLVVETMEATTLIRQRLESVGDVGQIKPFELVRLCIESKLTPPWLGIASGDRECAAILFPKEYDSNPAVPVDGSDRDSASRQPTLSHGKVSSLGGKARSRSLFGSLDDAVDALLDEACRLGFPTRWFNKDLMWFTKSNPSEICTRKASKSLLKIGKLPPNSDDLPYTEPAVDRRVNTWKEKYKLAEKTRADPFDCVPVDVLYHFGM